jgi:hypothetical protein
MDPLACFNHLAELIEEEQWQEARDVAEDLLGWLSAEGFAPHLTGHKNFDRLVAESVCQRILES